MATEVGSIYYDLKLDDGKFNDGIQRVTKSVNNATMSFGKMSLAVAAGQAIYNAAARSFGMLTDFIGSAVDEARLAQEAEIKLTQAIKNGSKATDEQAQSLIRYAEALQFEVGISHEEIESGMAMLATFKLNTDQIKSMIPSLIDMATMYRRNTGEQVDLAQTAIMLGKATGGELYKNLQRVGIIFDDNQLAMLENADAAGRLKIITEELGNEFGGQALAQATTFGGKMQILGLYFDEFRESIGLAIINALTPFINKIMDWARTDQGKKTIQDITTAVANMAGQMVSWIVNVAIPWVQKHWPEIQQGIKNTWNVLWGLWNFLRVFGEAFYNIFISPIVNGINAATNTARFFWDIVVGIGNGFYRMVVAPIVDGIRAVVDWLNRMKDNAKGAYDAVNNALSIGGNAKKKTGNSLVDWWNGLPLFAEGTNYAPGGMAIVGERGPELVNLPRGSKVFSNQDSRQMVGNTTATFTGNIYLQDKSAVDAFFGRLSRNQELAQKGMGTL